MIQFLLLVILTLNDDFDFINNNFIDNNFMNDTFTI